MKPYLSRIRYFQLLVVVFSLILTQSCTHQVVRTNESEPIDLSGKWNDTDSRMVSEHAVEKLIEDNWHRKFFSRYDRKPIIQMGKIINRTTEHIEIQSFTNDIETALINSNQFSVIASGNARAEIRQERQNYQDSQEHVGGTRITIEKQANFILRGSIHSLVDQVKDTTLMYYQINLELVTLADNEIVWKTQKKIKKIVKKPTVAW